MSNNGMTIDDIKKEIASKVKGNHISQSALEQLIAIFNCNSWITQDELIRRIYNARDPICLEEAGRVVINPWLFYEEYQSRYYVFGG